MNPRLDILQRSRFFHLVPRGMVSSALAANPSRELQAGDTLLRTGQPNRTLYVVLVGSLRVQIGDPDSPPHTTIGPGECTGELSIIDSRPATADVIANEPTVVLEIDREQLWGMVDVSPELARNLLEILAGRIRHDDLVIGESGRLQRHFERAATVDGLTGLRNRRWLDEAFTRQLTRTLRGQRPVSMLIIDVDGFHTINEHHGHLVGDAVLCRVSQVLANHLRPQDLLARYGGDEFALLLPETDTEEAVLVGDRLCASIHTASIDPGHEPLPPMSVSIGVATARLSDSLSALLSLADAALYRAKHAGRNRVSR